MRFASLAVVTIIVSGCADSASPPQKDAVIDAPHMTQAGCQQTPGCWTDPVEPDEFPDSPGLLLPTYYTPTQCFATSTGNNAFGEGINDLDRDGLDDNCEGMLAEKFVPQYVVSPYDCDIRGVPHWAAKYFPVKSGGPTKATVRIIFLSAFYQDCGTPGYGTIAGIACDYDAKDCAGHFGDSEFMTLDIRFNSGTRHWYVSNEFLSAHYLVTGESSRAITTCYFESACTPTMTKPNGGSSAAVVRWVDKPGGRPVFYLASGKHGAYPDYNTCNNGGTAGLDNCTGSPTNSIGTAQFFSRNRNVGSWQHRNIDVVSLPSDPLHPGTEKFWTYAGADTLFFGWLGSDGKGSTHYARWLVHRFECYRAPTIAGADALYSTPLTEINLAICDRGMVR